MGRTYVSTEVTERGQERALVPGSQLLLSFSSSGVTASAGCNTLTAEGGIQDGRLVLDRAASTEIGCEPELASQEQWWASLLLSQPEVELGDRALTLRDGQSAVAMVSQEVIPDEPLTDTVWQLDTILGGGTSSTVPSGTAATLEIGADAVEVSIEGCGEASVAAEIGSATITVDPDDVGLLGCQDDAAVVERALGAVFGIGEADYVVEGGMLTITGPFGAGLVFRAS